MHSVRCKCTFLLLGAHLGHRGWHFGCRCVHSVGCCMLAAGATPSSCTPTSAATSTPAPPSICINLRLHIFSPPSALLIRMFSRWTTVGGVCPPVQQLFPCLPASTWSAPVHSGHPTIAHLAPQVDASHITNVHSPTKKFQGLEGACMTFHNCAFLRC